VDSIIIRARQVIAAHRTDELAALCLQPLGANWAETDGILFALSFFDAIGTIRSRAYVYMAFHGPTVIT
jgi:hypothetical protein